MTRRHYPSDELIAREIKRAITLFGGVKSWELTPDGRVIVLPDVSIRAEAGAPLADGGNEMAEARKRRDANRLKGAR